MKCRRFYRNNVFKTNIHYYQKLLVSHKTIQESLLVSDLLLRVILILKSSMMINIKWWNEPAKEYGAAYKKYNNKIVIADVILPFISNRTNRINDR